MRHCSTSNLALIFFGLFCLRGALAAESTRSLEQRIQSIEVQLLELPKREPGESGGNMGIFVRRQTLTSESAAATLDLGKSYPIDHIVLVPTRLRNISRQMEGVGFPQRFDLVGAEDEDFTNPIYFYAGADTDYPDPNGYPVFFDGKGHKVRYLRIIVYEMSQKRWRHEFLLAELFVFSEGRNVALKKPVKTALNITWDNFFSDAFLVDGQTSLGQPIMQNTPSPSVRGWHAKVRDNATCNETIELQFDEPHEIEEIRLYPVQHSIWPRNTDYGFPINFRVQIKEPDADWITIEDWSETPFPPPGNSPVFIPLKSRTAQAVRLQAFSLPQSIPTKYIFALAEMEVHAGGTNIAPQGNITTSSLHAGFPNEWNEQALTDGFATRGKIIPVLNWLKGLALRGKLEAELEQLTEQLTQRQKRTALTLRLTVRTLSAALLLAGGTMVYNRKKRRKQLQELKNTIASDLHDEVGSNLASITILAAGEKEQSAPRHADSLQKIVDIARETSTSMQDIVWMLHPDRKTNISLNTKLRDIASNLLADTNFSLTDSEEIPADQLPMDTLHHFLLFYKEALHNLARHSNAQQVEITLCAQRKTIRLEIIDNGMAPPSGSLPEGLKLRAGKMGACLTYQVHADHNHLTLEIP